MIQFKFHSLKSHINDISITYFPKGKFESATVISDPTNMTSGEYIFAVLFTPFGDGTPAQLIKIAYKGEQLVTRKDTLIGGKTFKEV